MPRSRVCGTSGPAGSGASAGPVYPGSKRARRATKFARKERTHNVGTDEAVPFEPALFEDADAAIRRGAESAGVPVSQFIVEAAVERAERQLADRTGFVLDDEQWGRFVELLDRPPRSVPAVRELLSGDDAF